MTGGGATAAESAAVRTAAAPRDLLFISYSHHDKRWLTDFLILLEPYVPADRRRVWSDRDIRPGDAWPQEIQSALERAGIGVLMVSEHFLASPFIQRNELPQLVAAATAGGCKLLPILISWCGFGETALGAIQFLHPIDKAISELPKSKRNRVWVQICEAIQDAVREAAAAAAASREPEPVAAMVIEAPLYPLGPGITGAEVPAEWKLDPSSSFAAPARINIARDDPGSVAAGLARETEPLLSREVAGALRGVPLQRPYFVPREELAAITDAVLGSAAAVGVTGTAFGLHGMGGIGKTELAVALCHEEQVHRAFPDGLYWLTLGQAPDLLARLTDLADLAGVARASAGAFVSIIQVQQALKAHFRDRAALLVLDDLWHLADARELAVLGPHGRTLVTTRDARLLTALGAREVSLDVLNPSSARTLLARWAGQDPLPAGLTVVADAIAEECGHLPLALALAGARIRDGIAWEQALGALRDRDRDFLKHPYGNVFDSLRLSVDALAPDARERYGELAAFPEDVPIPLATVARLWAHTAGLNAAASEDFIITLARKALLTWSAEARSIGFHDLQQDFLRLDADDLPALYRTLLDAHRPASGRWPDLPPDEPYLWRWLAWHLAQADREDELGALLLDPAWLWGKLNATDIHALIGDFDHAPADPELGLVQHALTLSVQSLWQDRSQLSGQLIGRLLPSQAPAISMLRRALESFPVPWTRLIPKTPSFTPAGSPLERIIIRGEWVDAFTFLPDGNRTLTASNTRLSLWSLIDGSEIWSQDTGSAMLTCIAVGRCSHAVHDQRYALDQTRSHIRCCR
jgi:hypothetical protein